MQSYKLPLNKIIKYIGQIGELIFEEFLKNEDIFVLAKEFKIADYKETGSGIRVDYIVCNNVTDILILEEKILKNPNAELYKTLDIKSVKNATGINRIINDSENQIVRNHSKVFVYHDDVIKIYDLKDCYENKLENYDDDRYDIAFKSTGLKMDEVYDDVINNFIFVELKSSTSRNYRKKQKVKYYYSMKI